MGTTESRPVSLHTDDATHYNGPIQQPEEIFMDPSELAGFSKFLQTSPEAERILQRCLDLIQRLEATNTGITLITKAQYYLVQTFFERKSKLDDASRKKSSKKGKREDPVQINGELDPEDISLNEHHTLESMQKCILHHASDINHIVTKLLATLIPAIPETHGYLVTPQHVPARQPSKTAPETNKNPTNNETAFTRQKHMDTPDRKQLLKNEKNQGVGGNHKGQLEKANEMEELKKTLSSLKQENIKLTESLIEIEVTLTEKNELYKCVQEKYDNALTELEETKKSIVHLRKLDQERQQQEKVEMDKLTSEHASEKQTLLETCRQFKDELSKLNEDNEQKNREISYFKQIIITFETQNSQTKTDNVELVKDVKHWKYKYDALVKENDVKVKQKISEFEALERENDSSQAEIDQKISEIKTLEKELDDTQSVLEQKVTDISRLEADCNQSQSVINTLRRERRQLKKQLDESETTIKHLTNERDMLQRQQADIQAERERLLQRKKVSLIMYIPRRGDLLNAVVGELRAKISSHFDDRSYDVTLTEVDTSSQIVPNTPVLVVCINASRLGTDVSNALNGVKVNSQMAVIVLHHKEVHALPNQSSERVLTSVEYKALGGIFDMACLSSRGLYNCDMNTHAITGLVDFIKQRN